MATVDQFCDAVLGEVGYVEQGGADGHSGNITKFAAEAGHPNGYAWCVTMLVAIAHRTRLSVPYEGSNALACANAFQAVGKLHPEPQRGDWVVFHGPDFPEGHIECVVGVFPDRSLDDVGGNTSDGTHGSQWNGGMVARRHRPRAQIVGFCRPDYEDATQQPQEDDSMKPVASTPSWCTRQADGAFPRFKATPDGNDAVVVSLDNAPFTPAWGEGAHAGYTDFAAYGLWCRRFIGGGEPFDFAETVDGSFFLIAANGTFDVAHR